MRRNRNIVSMEKKVRHHSVEKICLYRRQLELCQWSVHIYLPACVHLISLIHIILHYPSKHILGGKSPELSASQGSSERPSRKVSGQSTCCSYVVRDPTKFYFPFSALPSGGLDLHLCSSENHLYRRALHLCLVSPSA